MTDKIFADGFIAKRHDNAPDFVIVGLSVKVSEAVEFLQQNESNGWVNLQVKQSKTGKYYVELDTWRPTQGDAAKGGIVEANRALRETAVSDFDDTEIPFS